MNTIPEKPSNLIGGALAAFSASCVDEKTRLARMTAKLWFERKIARGLPPTSPVPERPGRPEAPHLLPPSQVPRRPLNTETGRIALIHAIAHIELNAIDLALDIIVRFANHPMPRSFFDDWMRVADEEAKHFCLLQNRLKELGASYGDLPAHDGLWEAAGETGADIVARLAVVPLVLEARGLDVTPPLIEKLVQAKDEATARIFQIIYDDEKGHVAVGAKWFRFLCARDGKDPNATFQSLVRKHFRGYLKPPFNDNARSANGLTPLFYRSLSPAGN